MSPFAFQKKQEKKVTATKLPSPSSASCCNNTKQKEGDGSCRPFLPSKKEEEKGDGSKAVIPFFFFLL